MTFLGRLITTTLASFAVTNFIVSLFVLLIWLTRRNNPNALARASFLFRLRLLPILSSVFVTFLSIVSFVRFEPPGADETFGSLLIYLPIATAMLLIVGAGRLMLVLTRTRSLTNGLMVSAERLALPTHFPIPAYAVDSTFPVVAVVGVIRPKLVIARSVLAACSDQELTAVLKHEEAHLRRHDNARRLLMASLPDFLAWFPLSKHLDIAWRQAVEEAADNAVGDESSRLSLAGALLRIARMAPPEPLAGNELTASAFYSGAPLEMRVRRLMDYAVPETVTKHHWLWSVAIFALLCFASVAVLRPLHEIMEIAVRYLP